MGEQVKQLMEHLDRVNHALGAIFNGMNEVAAKLEREKDARVRQEERGERHVGVSEALLAQAEKQTAAFERIAVALETLAAQKAGPTSGPVLCACGAIGPCGHNPPLPVSYAPDKCGGVIGGSGAPCLFTRPFGSPCSNAACSNFVRVK